MPVIPIRYEFRQPFRVPARAAFEWCTDFRPSDAKLFEQKWQREVRRLSPDALILTETTYPKGKVRVIQRLVRVNDQNLAWTNTHISGPFLHSQYWYRVVPDGARRSHLVFTGMRLVRTSRVLSAAEKARLTEQERSGDSRLWRRRIAPALERALAGSKAKKRPKRRT